jgi:hypothetical protein
MLTQEIATNYYSPTPDTPRHLAANMLTAIAGFDWMEHPLELVYQEVILKRGPSAGLGLNPIMTGIYRDWMADLHGHMADLKALFRGRHEQKQKRVAENKRFRKAFKDPKNPDALILREDDEDAFVQKAELFLNAKLIDPDSRAEFLAHRCKGLDKLHKESVGQTQAALAELDPGNIAAAPFTHDYLLAGLLYLLAPVTRIGPEETMASNPLVLSGDQVNNEEDEEYVTSAVLCDYLLTCDKGMHRMSGLLNRACLLKHPGARERRPVLLPRAEVDHLQRLLDPLV